MKQIQANQLGVLPLGRQGENLARQVVFDLSAFAAEYGPGTAELIYQRPVDAAPYPVAAVREGDTLVWTLTATDTDCPSDYGHCELRYYVGETLVKSKTWRTWVEPAMDTPSETAPPEPEQGWVDQIIAVGAASKASADAAKADADRAAGVVQAVTDEGTRQVQAVRDEGITQTSNAKAQADAAKLSADAAAQSATDAANAKTGADTAKDAAVTAQGKAEDAKKGAEVAKTESEASKEASAKSEAAAKASEANAAGSASAAAESATAAQTAQSGAEAAKTAAARSAQQAAESAAVYGEVVSDVTQLKQDLAYMLESSENMLNPENNLRETYATANGIQASSDYAIWFTTEKIKVVGGNVLQCNTPVNSIVIYNADGTSDKINSVSKLYNTVDFPFTLPLTADSVILTFRMTYIDSEIMVNMGSELLPYKPYGYKEFNNSLIELKENPVNAKLNNANTTSDFLSDFKQSLAKNVVVNYVANFETFNSLKIGYTSKDDFSASGGYTDYFEITPTQLIMHREDVQDVAWEHGLTIEKFIGVELSFDITKNYTLTITTIGGTYTKSNYIYLGRTYYPFAVIDGTNVRNNKLSATCKDLRKNIFAFGDSYFSNASSRWMYYLQNKDSICINQYAGESSASAIVDFRTLVKYGNPKFVLWCLGMNDKTDTDENTPNQNWLPYIQEVIETCETNNIVPILATIPSVPNISHKGKNKWIRESGYHYIDFAKAVESDDNGNWYNGLLSSDNVHPTEKGAKVLYSRAIVDFADLLVIN